MRGFGLSSFRSLSMTVDSNFKALTALGPRTRHYNCRIALNMRDSNLAVNNLTIFGLGLYYYITLHGEVLQTRALRGKKLTKA